MLALNVMTLGLIWELELGQEMITEIKKANISASLIE